jgi:GntR family transcriptional regulator
MTFPKIHNINDSTPLTQRLVAQLREMITEGALAPGYQLPNENELALQFNVSRSTIRTALQTLEKVGFVIRKRGIGTFVSDEPLQVNNLSLNWGVTQVIRSTGSTPGTLGMVVSVLEADDLIIERLNVESGTPMLFIERVRTADERRVVFSQDFIPIRLIHGFQEAGSDENVARRVADFLNHENPSLYVFIEANLSERVHHAIAHISPLAADVNVADKLDIPFGSGILYLEQVDYNSEGDPLWLAKEYHVANAFTFAVYRSM